jgi:Holliday junction resolvase
MRVRARADSNHTEIVKAFRACGASVLDTKQLGNGAPDIVVGLNKQCIAVEIKDGKKVPSKRKLTPDEVKFHDEWQGWIEIVYSTEDVINLVNKIRSGQCQ